MATVTIHEAKTQLSKLIARVEAGEEVVIARGKNPVVRLMPIAPACRDRKGGWLKGPDLPSSFFFDPLPDDELALWNGEGPDAVEP